MSAIRPWVISATSGRASSTDAAPCVAPIFLAASILNATGSTATSAGPGEPGPLEGAVADAAAADHDDDLAGTGLRPVDHGAEAGRDPATDERGRLERRVRGQLDQRRLVDHERLGERAELGHPAEVLLPQVVTPRPVADHRPGQRVHAEVAEVLAAGRAPEAHPAGRDETRRHAVAHGDVLDLRTDRADHARALMTPDDGVDRGDPEHREELGRGRDVAQAQMLVGVAQPGVSHLDLDLVGVRLVDLDLLGRPRRPLGVADRCLCLHGIPPVLNWPGISIVGRPPSDNELLPRVSSLDTLIV
jgi:hypothetical protein